VRNRLDSFQQGVQTARQMRDSFGDEDGGGGNQPWRPSPDVQPLQARRPAVPSGPAGPSGGFGIPAGPPSGSVQVAPPSGPMQVGPASGPVQFGPPSGPMPVAEHVSSPAASGPSSGPLPTSGADGEAKRGREGGFGVFYRDYLPQLLALLMIEGARPGAAAQIAQDAMSEAYREWAQLENPREWTRQVAMSTWSVQRRSAGPAEPVAGSSGSSGAAPSGSPDAAPSGAGGAADGAPTAARPVNGLPTRSRGLGRG